MSSEGTKGRHINQFFSQLWAVNRLLKLPYIVAGVVDYGIHERDEGDHNVATLVTEVKQILLLCEESQQVGHESSIDGVLTPQPGGG